MKVIRNTFLGQPDEEYFDFIEDDTERTRLNKSLGYIWDYTPRLWNKYMSIDNFFRSISEKVRFDKNIKRKIWARSKRIKEILGG